MKCSMSRQEGGKKSTATEWLKSWQVETWGKNIQYILRLLKMNKAYHHE